MLKHNLHTVCALAPVALAIASVLLGSVPSCSLDHVASRVDPIDVETGGACADTEQCRAGHECVDGVCLRILGQSCDGGEQCASGVCAGDLCCENACDRPCDAGCDSAGLCQAAIDGATCDDSDACTSDDVCNAGACVGDTVLSCLGPSALSDVSAIAGIEGTPDGTEWGVGYGIAWGDYDNDGWQDLWLGVQGPPDGLDVPIFYGHLFHNDGDGSFSEVASAPEGKRGGYWADPDNDGDLDIFTTAKLWEDDPTPTEVRFYLNEAGAFTEIGESAGFVNIDNLGNAAWLDANADGYIDLFTPSGENFDSVDPPPGPNEIRLNSGASPLLFTVYTDAGLDIGASNGETCTVADVDNDGDTDIWYNDQTDGSLYLNDGEGGFSEAAAAAGLSIDMGIPPDHEQPYYATLFGDYDNDGWLDLFLAHPDGTANRLYRNRTGEVGSISFELQTAPGFLNQDLGHTRGAAWGDYDHDGDLDLALGNEEYDSVAEELVPAANSFFENRGAAGFVDVADDLGLNAGPLARTGSVSFADYDNDGDLDLFFTNRRSPSVLWRNELNDDKHLHVSAVGRGAGFSSRDGIGTRIELWDQGETTLLAIREVSGGEGYGSQSPRIVHFGLAAGWGGGDGTYTVKARFVSKKVATVGAVVPNKSTLTVGSTTLANTIEILEPLE